MIGIDEAIALAVDQLRLGRADIALVGGTEATIQMQARKGRASYLGERSIGHQDAGATSTLLLLTALRDRARL